MCIPNMEFQLVNPTTQVALYSVCVGNCSSIKNITWNVYSGSTNSSSNTTVWTQFNQMNVYENIWFFGKGVLFCIYNILLIFVLGTETDHFTALKKLFIDNSQIDYWRFEVVYSFATETSSSALNFVINQPPRNGSCSIAPFNGTTSTSFSITCSNWVDADGIEDYSIYSMSHSF
jgi:hypothetical protein